MATKSTAPKKQPIQGNSIDDVLNDTEIGAFVAKYKVLVFGAIIASLVAVAAYAIYSQQRTEKLFKYGAELYSFENEKLMAYTKGTLDASVLAQEFSQLDAAKMNYEGAIPLAVKISDELRKKEKFSEALNILETMPVPKEGSIAYFLLTRKATLAEEMGEFTKAISSLEMIVTNNIKLLEGKTYFDLGRLYMKKGDNVKAKEFLEKSLTFTAHDQFKKMAKIYLKKIGS